MENTIVKPCTRSYLASIGVQKLNPKTSPFDPGYDPVTLISHLEQSSHLMSCLKISMACWQIANEESTREKIDAANRLNVPTVTGGGTFEVACHYGKLPEFLDLIADMGVTRFEAGEGFIPLKEKPADIMKMANERGLEVQFEIGEKHSGAFTAEDIEELIIQSNEWLDAGVKQIIVEARESAAGVGLFSDKGLFYADGADRLVSALGFDALVFEAPTKASQFTLLNHFGADVHICNVRMEELLRVEIYRRGLHSDAFKEDSLRPPK